MTDAEIEAYGKNLGEAFENAGRAVENLMVDLDSIKPAENRQVELSTDDLESLLYQWVDSLISLEDTEGLLFSKFSCDVQHRAPAKWNLSAKLSGEIFDPEKHEQKTAIKAATFHDMKITTSEGQKVTMRFLVDL